jgi:hypothetical protein
MNRINSTRADFEMANIIEAGIELEQVHGAASAWAMMAAHGVPPATILRVLAEPQHRRGGASAISYVVSLRKRRENAEEAARLEAAILLDRVLRTPAKRRPQHE